MVVKKNGLVTKSYLDVKLRGLENRLESKLESKLEEKTKDLATKKDIADVMWELKTMREENAVLADMKRQVNDHEDRIELVENKLNIPQIAA